jgi:hypothetical protein
VIISEETQFNVECPQNGRVALQDPSGNSSASDGDTVTLVESTDVLPSSPTPSPTSDGD